MECDRIMNPGRFIVYLPTPRVDYTDVSFIFKTFRVESRVSRHSSFFYPSRFEFPSSWFFFRCFSFSFFPSAIFKPYPSLLLSIGQEILHFHETLSHVQALEDEVVDEHRNFIEMLEKNLNESRYVRRPIEMRKRIYQSSERYGKFLPTPSFSCCFPRFIVGKSMNCRIRWTLILKNTPIGCK